MSGSQALLLRVPLREGRQLSVATDGVRVGDQLYELTRIREAWLTSPNPEQLGLTVSDVGVVELESARPGDGIRALNAIYSLRPDLRPPATPSRTSTAQTLPSAPSESVSASTVSEAPIPPAPAVTPADPAVPVAPMAPEQPAAAMESTPAAASASVEASPVEAASPPPPPPPPPPLATPEAAAPSVAPTEENAAPVNPPPPMTPVAPAPEQTPPSPSAVTNANGANPTASQPAAAPRTFWQRIGDLFRGNGSRNT